MRFLEQLSSGMADRKGWMKLQKRQGTGGALDFGDGGRQGARIELRVQRWAILGQSIDVRPAKGLIGREEMCQRSRKNISSLAVRQTRCVTQSPNAPKKSEQMIDDALVGPETIIAEVTIEPVETPLYTGTLEHTRFGRF